MTFIETAAYSSLVEPLGYITLSPPLDSRHTARSIAFVYAASPCMMDCMAESRIALYASSTRLTVPSGATRESTDVRHMDATFRALATLPDFSAAPMNSSSSTDVWAMPRASKNGLAHSSDDSPMPSITLFDLPMSIWAPADSSLAIAPMSSACHARAMAYVVLSSTLRRRAAMTERTASSTARPSSSTSFCSRS